MTENGGVGVREFQGDDVGPVLWVERVGNAELRAEAHDGPDDPSRTGEAEGVGDGEAVKLGVTVSVADIVGDDVGLKGGEGLKVEVIVREGVTLELGLKVRVEL